MSTATPTRPLPDLNAIHRTIAEAHSRAAELEAREASLALSGLAGDENDRTELAAVQAERDACLLRARDGELAIAEHARLSAEAKADAERERIAGELGKARKLAARYRALAGEVDSAGQAYAEKLAELARVHADLNATAQRGGERALLPAGSAVTASLLLALRKARVPGSYLEFAGIAPRPGLLAETLPRQAFERDTHTSTRED